MRVSRVPATTLLFVYQLMAVETRTITAPAMIPESSTAMWRNMVSALAEDLLTCSESPGPAVWAGAGGDTTADLPRRIAPQLRQKPASGGTGPPQLEQFTVQA